MTRFPRALAAPVAIVAALALGACGGDDKQSADTKTSGGTPAAGKTGGTLKAVFTSNPDFMDPALSYTQEGWNLLWTVYTPLLTYRHEEGAGGSELIPGLATALPKVTNGGKTYELTLRKGLKYSDGTPVKASDFERTVQRVLNLESGGSSFYLPITGAEEYVKAGKATKDIPGIVTDDATGKITIKLKEVNGSFSNILAMDFVGLVPGDTPFKNLTKDPPPGVGQFKITESVPNRRVTMVRNENFPQIPDVPAAKLDRIEATIVKSQQRQVQDALRNRVDYVNDPPPGDQIRNVKEQAAGRYAEYVTNSTYYMFLNAREKPFDDIKVRQAVNTGLDKRALARLYGGLLETGCNFLPPGMKGYQKIEPCPYGDPKAAPDLTKARKMIEAAGAKGEKVTVYGRDEDPSRQVTENLAAQLNEMGLTAKPKIVEASVYFTTIGNEKTKAQAGDVNWFQDYPAPSNFVFLIDGKSIQSTNNQNFGNTDDPEINRLIAEANKNPKLDAVAGDYAKADRLAVEKGYVAAYGHRKLTKFVSDKVDFKSVIAHPVYNVDLVTMALK